jgi:hypothetical protein
MENHCVLPNTQLHDEGMSWNNGFFLGDSVSRELVREDENQMEQGCQTHRMRFTLI